MRRTTKSADDTLNLGREVADFLKPGDAVCISGDLGAGKTVLVNGIAAGLGIKRSVKSPSFVIMNIYEYGPAGETKLLVHVDAYRISDPVELAGIGLQEYLDRDDAMVVMEWPENARGIMPDDCVEIHIEHGESEDERVIRLPG